MTLFKHFILSALLFGFSHLGFSQTILWNQSNIDKLSTNSNEFSKKVLKEADKALKQSISTVVDKEMTPVSGSKHDYMSAGRYWWPDPTKKDGLPYIRKDGVVNREIDKLDRIPLSKMCTSIETLALAYAISKEEKYAQKGVENLRRWFLDEKTKMNPNMDYGQTIPGRNQGKGRGEGVIDTYSFVEMLDAVAVLEKSKALTNKDKEGLTRWFEQYLNWMLTSPIGQEEYNAKNNHGTAFDVQVVRYALFTGNTSVAKKFLTEFPVRRLFTQIETDGRQPLELERTTAMGYSIFNLVHILDMCKMGKLLNVELIHTNSKDGRNIAKAVGFIAQFLGKPQSSFPYQQIKEWDDKQKELALLIYRYEQMSNDQQFHSIIKNKLDEIHQQKESLLY